MLTEASTAFEEGVSLPWKSVVGNMISFSTLFVRSALSYTTEGCGPLLSKNEQEARTVSDIYIYV